MIRDERYGPNKQKEEQKHMIDLTSTSNDHIPQKTTNASPQSHSASLENRQSDTLVISKCPWITTAAKFMVESMDYLYENVWWTNLTSLIVISHSHSEKPGFPDSPSSVFLPFPSFVYRSQFFQDLHGENKHI